MKNHGPNPTGPDVDDEPMGPNTARIVGWLRESPYPPLVRPVGQGEFPPEDDRDCRPTLRPPVPVVTVLDDGSRDRGEEFRLRRETFTIGRTSGHVEFPADHSMSGMHAEIRRQPWQGGWQWILHDLGSTNGTFARCVRAVLHENAILLLGSRRFRLRNPLRPRQADIALDGHTMAWSLSPIPDAGWPILVETSRKGDPVQYELRRDTVTLGRTGGGCDIALDDPLLAYHHATFTRQPDNTWLISAEHTRNGIWVSVTNIPLTSHCYFRCGEQAFRFLIP